MTEINQDFSFYSLITLILSKGNDETLFVMKRYFIFDECNTILLSLFLNFTLRFNSIHYERPSCENHPSGNLNIQYPLACHSLFLSINGNMKVKGGHLYVFLLSTSLTIKCSQSLSRPWLWASQIWINMPQNLYYGKKRIWKEFIKKRFFLFPPPPI